VNRNQLAGRFVRQQAFATGYSPLYSRLFGAVAAWLSAPDAESDPLVTWLLEAAKDRRTLDVSLLLASGLHRDILAGEVQVADLARYYPTTGGDLPPEGKGFEESLRSSILARSDSLAQTIRHGNVQTNETGRGLCWLLPSMLTGWSHVHLVDLGASAGLNLLADQRSYRLVDVEAAGVSIDIGQAPAPQFITQCTNVTDLFERLGQKLLPLVESRTGCDAAPFRFQTKADETTLKSFIWGDQVDRMERLCEGLEAYRRAQESSVPAYLYRCQLPQELGVFLEQRLPAGPPQIPVVIYNTYLTAYLTQKGRGIVDQIGSWASRQKRPVLWLQWEPVRDAQNPAVEGWIAWTAGLWQEGKHQSWLIGWVHPHGGEAIFEGG